MKNDIYHLVTVADGKSDNASIIKVFSEMAKGRLKCDLRLLNYFDEVPVSYGSSITTVDEDSVELALHEHQALIIKHHKNTLIKSSHFHNELAVHCYAAYVSVPKKTAILHNFAYAQIRAERREAVRVKVHGKLPVTFSYDNINIEGNLVDISGNGISINSNQVTATDTDQSGVLSFSLAGTNLAVPGSFIRCATNGKGEHICIFQMKPDRRSDNLIGQFIYQRQVEIIQQLKEGLVVE
jgi:PilZ domain